jgi:three-Cys-motif partner protein
MPGKNLFRKPFDEGTLVKLKVFKDYFKEWLPVFVSRNPPIWKAVQIFDFFAGPGEDENGEPGSPLIALQIVKSVKDLIMARGITVILHFNEKDAEKFEKLKDLEGNYGYYEVKTYNNDFNSIFLEKYGSMKDSGNFLFFDQNGVKEITKELFNKIIQLKQTDFLLFISSSYFKRFAKTPEFQKYFPFDPSEVAETDYFHIHRKVLQHYKSLIHPNKTYYLAPFSIKKGPNIYGLIFGTPHTLGIEKFLSVAWKNDKLRGEANYDIDNEKIDLKAPSLFEAFNKPNKRQVFEQNLTDHIINKRLTDKHSVYEFTLNEGFLYRDANAVLEKLRGSRITFDFKTITGDLHKDTDNGKITVK